MHVLLLPLLFSLVLPLSAVVPVPTEIVPQRVAGAKARNVVFILADDHRYDAMSFMGHPVAETPHLDAMARNGVHLKNALVTTALCSPSRASILTGLYTFRHRVIDNNRAIPAGTVYFPQYLQKSGYATAFIGKWHMGGDSDEKRPGFDHWISFRGQGNYLSPNPNYTLNVDGKRVPQRGYITDEMTDYALEWIGKQQPGAKPFFLYLSHKAVHANFTPAPRHEGKLAGRPMPKPKRAAAGANQPRWVADQRNSWHGADFPYHSELDIEKYYQRYCETLCAVDDSVGRVMAKLKEMGILDETLVIYMGDNGFMFGEHGLIDKRVAYEPSIRVPMLMQCPDLFKGGTVVDRVVANIDVAPTIMEAAGLAAPAHFDGRSFVSLAQGKTVPWRDYFLYVYYWEKNFPQSPTVFSLRGDRYKYITYYGLWDADELYDLQADPDELRNLLYDPKLKSVAVEMEKKLYAMMGELGGMEIPLNPPLGGSQNKRLRGRGGERGADFPAPLVVEKPINTNAN
ncbi:MAG: acetylglucosamine-6-sulfatase [Opitutia bacterium Tous-C1TDCM]|nr:MAG: acetylglucosamine-6-sulfatase [Opitutae bacterium Tous-C1TDCM]